MKFMNALEQARWHMMTLWGALFLSFLLNVFLVVGWHLSENHLRIDLPPEIPQSGLQLQKNEVPKATVYAFAFYIWQRLNHWEQDGKTDYRQQIETLAPFLTPKFRVMLIDDYNDLLEKGEVQERIRFMSGISNRSYSSDSVHYSGNGVWQVTLPIRLTEMMAMNAHVVKDTEMTYILRVTRQDMDAEKNPWGLALDGWVTPPTRDKTHI